LHPANTLTERLLLGTVMLYMVVRHLLANGPAWPEPLEIYAIADLALKAANIGNYNRYTEQSVARSEDAPRILDRPDKAI
jgi:hypothetical protein